MNRYMVCLDTETTGVDTDNDRIVTAFVGLMDTTTGSFVKETHVLINPGPDVVIPEGATAVHGITTEYAREHGEEPTAALMKVLRALTDANPTCPLVIYNAPFDLAILRAEGDRHFGKDNFSLLAYGPGHVPVIDPYVIDQALVRFRKGPGARKLTTLVGHYGVPLETNAHDAAADCLMAGRIALTQLRGQGPTSLATKLRMKAGEIETMEGLRTLHAAQIGWKATQAAGLQQYFRRTEPEAYVNPGWPYPAPKPQEATQ